MDFQEKLEKRIDRLKATKRGFPVTIVLTGIPFILYLADDIFVKHVYFSWGTISWFAISMVNLLIDANILQQIKTIELIRESHNKLAEQIKTGNAKK